MSNPSQIVVTVQLDKCCQGVIEDIKYVLETGKLLQGILVIAPFALLFGLKAKPSLNSSISFARRDWDLWAKSVGAANQITRAKCRQLCQFHQLKHRGGPENKFWREMEQSFR